MLGISLVYWRMVAGRGRRGMLPETDKGPAPGAEKPAGAGLAGAVG